ncbi:hypothetical protein K501DRAFT_331192 [Backusella circina FSU 941]|nr:hypothetical protein K501DRAFT_331192 [Backusella circina FSU 941]
MTTLPTDILEEIFLQLHQHDKLECMLPLPTEILGGIFHFLDQDEKLECMLVCHYWYQTIKQLALYHTINIYCSSNLKLLKNKMEKYPNIGSKVERLVLSFSNEKCLVYLKKVLLLLPNIKTLVCSGKEKGKIALEQGIQFPWHSTIEHICEDSRYGIGYQLLSVSVCPLLTTLTIMNGWKNIIPFLINAPALKHLAIHNLELDFDSLEIIHSSLSDLKTLSLTGVDFPISFFPRPITPAISITECTIDLNNVRVTENRIDLLVYIRKKYPNLHKLSYHIDQFIVSDDEVKPLYNMGWIPLFMKFGPQLGTLSLDNNGFGDDLFPTLATFSCSIHHLQVNFITQASLTKLSKSLHSFNCIHTLCLNNTKVDSFRWLNKLQVLKKLKLYYYFHGVHVKMDQIIRFAPPSLTTLSLDNGVLVYHTKNSRMSNVETISLNRVTVPKKMETIINRHFPNLSKLKLKHCDMIGRSLTLPMIQLHHFHLTDNFRLGNNLVLIISEYNHISKQVKYNVQGVDYRRLSEGTCKQFGSYMTYPSLKSYIVNDCSTIVPDFTLHCKSIPNVIFSQ